MKIALNVYCEYCTKSHLNCMEPPSDVEVSEEFILLLVMEKGWGVVRVQEGSNYKDRVICSDCLSDPIS